MMKKHIGKLSFEIFGSSLMTQMAGLSIGGTLLGTWKAQQVTSHDLPTCHQVGRRP